MIGAARSGTSILCEALRFGAGIPGYREGYLFSTAYLLMSLLEGHWKQIGPGLEHFANEDRGDPRRRTHPEMTFEEATFRRLCGDAMAAHGFPL